MDNLTNHIKLFKPTFQQLSIPAIESSLEIQDWLAQFSDGQQSIAKTLLSRLKFVSRDQYASWFSHAMKQLPSGEKYALYSVRKLDDEESCYWSLHGAPVLRPAQSQGSEDLVYSLISNQVRSSSQELLDHPAISTLKESKVRNFVLIDDSIGSGKRVSGFINAMLKHPTFLSWWSFGWIRVYVLSFARTKGAEVKIINQVIGSNHGVRKFPKASKIQFRSGVVYDEDWLEERWGSNYQQFLDLCNGQKKVEKWARYGYGKVFSNLIFYHSVPNNIPGLLWFSHKNWKPLMPCRALPEWLRELLENDKKTISSQLSNEILNLLKLVKRGVRRTSSIAIRLSVDTRYAQNLLDYAVTLGLLTTRVRLTTYGLDRLMQLNQTKLLSTWDYSCYIPNSWCVGQEPIQPLEVDSCNQSLTDSIKTPVFMDGGVGEASLERSDAKAAAPPFSVTHHLPAVSRKLRDTDGPLGSKER
jgi:hypothetical protein